MLVQGPTKLTYTLLLIVLPLLLSVLGYYGVLFAVDQIIDKSDPKDPIGFLAFLAPVGALIGAGVGVIIGAVFLLVTHYKSKSKSNSRKLTNGSK